MNLQRCAQGHFYDADKYTSCPHCQSGGALGSTVPLDPTPVGIHPAGVIPSTLPIFELTPPPINDDGKTVDFENPDGKYSAKPVVGWLVCTKGKNKGKSFTLYSGKNFIGRLAKMSVCLVDEESVSREKHAIVVYDRKSNMFLAQPGESAELFYVNSEVVLAATPLKKNDRLQIGKAELMLIPCCDDVFVWDGIQE